MTPPQKDEMFADAHNAGGAMNEEKAKESIRACVDLGGDCDSDSVNGLCHAYEKKFLKKHQSKVRNNFDCPHCGQDLRLSPDAETEIEMAFERGAASERAKAEKLRHQLSKITHQMRMRKNRTEKENECIETADKLLSDYKASQEGGK